ncbi:MAG: HNH endonuclease [Alphaproteobacteria bacterium]|nr:HNH endonuclease [Alphaproteobacteria bacterium]
MRVGYARYIRSASWRNSPGRLEELRRSGHSCRLCGRGRPEAVITVHHRTYRNFGRERPEDLTTLCEECHREVTNILRRRRHEKLVIPFLDVARPRSRDMRSSVDVIPDLEVQD